MSAPTVRPVADGSVDFSAPEAVIERVREVWACYAPTTHNGVTVRRDARLVLTISADDEVDALISDLQQEETASRAQAENIGHPHHDATFVLYERAHTRSLVR